MKLSKMKVALAATSLSLALMSAPVMAQMQGSAADRAVAAWASGDHTTAIGIWMDMPNDADALYNLGQAYRTGRGVTAMPDRAEGYYQRALNAGHVRAGEQLGLMFIARAETRQQGMALLQEAANRGSPRASFAVGLMLAEPGPNQDLGRARSMIQTAANGNVPGAAEALSKLSGSPARPVVRTAAAVNPAVVQRAPAAPAPAIRTPAGNPVAVASNVNPARPLTVIERRAGNAAAEAATAATRVSAPRPAAVERHTSRPVAVAAATASAPVSEAPVPGIATDRPAAPVVAWWQ